MYFYSNNDDDRFVTGQVYKFSDGHYLCTAVYRNKLTSAQAEFRTMSMLDRIKFQLRLIVDQLKSNGAPGTALE